MKKLFIKKNTLTLALALLSLGTSWAQELKVKLLSQTTASIRLVNTQKKYLLLPIEETAPESTFKVICNNKLEQKYSIRLAKDSVDYLVPFCLDNYKGKTVNIDILSPKSVNGKTKWANHVTLTDEFDTTNCEKWRPAFHHTPTYAWMNDPNGMFYLDGTWHLYYQFGPYGSMWNNMHWGHATSTDLIHWTEQPVALAPDALGTIFSGSCVVDKNNTAGFGENAIIAIYTTDGDAKRQALAYSTDGGTTFTKYEGNPILEADIPDFRDPNMFWNESINAWNLVLAAGQEVRIYSSKNLKEWKEESRFGMDFGNHQGVWECPDLVKVKYNNSDKEKWVLIVNINPGGPFGGSATQYFVGSFDGHRFMCENEPQVTKWMDYGKDHYATVSFSNAPEGRTTVLAWMSNWEYANIVPTKQFRSANSIARDLFLYDAMGETYLGSRPAKEYDNQVLNTIVPGSDQTIAVNGSGTWVLANEKGEEVVIDYDEAKKTLSVTRTLSGITSFSSDFPTTTTATVNRKIKSIRLIIDKASIELFANDGEIAMTNLVFPTTPYKKVIKKTKK